MTSKANADFVTAPSGLTLTAAGSIAGATDFDVFSDAIADIEGAGGKASHILMPSSAWKALAALKTLHRSNLPILGVDDLSAGKVRRSIMDVPV